MLSYVGALVLVAGLMGGIAGFGSAVASATGCPPYGPGGCAASLEVTAVTQPPSGIVTLTVVGQNYGPSETVTFTVDGKFVGSTITNPAGNFATRLVLPAGLAAGGHTLTGVGDTSGKTASATFHLRAPSAAANPCPSAAAYHGASALTVVLAAVYTVACLPTQVPAGAGSGGSGAPAAAAQSSSSLPFTGTDAAALAGAAAFALALGGILVLTSRRRRFRHRG
jgi:hypothetical protein